MLMMGIDLTNITDKKNAKGFNIVRKPAPHPLRLVVDNDAATPERLAMSDGESIVTEDGARQFSDELLDRMARKGQLYPDAKINEACQLAGHRYYENWYGAGMGGLQAIDYGKVQGGQGGAGSAMPPSRIAAQHRAAYREARAILGSKYRKAVEPFLLEGQSDPVAVGKAISGAGDRVIARTVAIERFSAGLYLLARHYGFVV